MSEPAALGEPAGAAEPAGAGEPAAVSEPVWCDRCGESLAGATHETCAAARTLEPPRFCPYCRRRMRVQVFPAGWSARCVEHGERRGS